jgi:hypothetical protein
MFIKSVLQNKIQIKENGCSLESEVDTQVANGDDELSWFNSWLVISAKDKMRTVLKGYHHIPSNKR